MNDQKYWRGDIFFADLGQRVGSEQSGLRPVIILQNNTGNRYAPTLIVAPITSSSKKPDMPTHVHLDPLPGIFNPVPSQILLEQIMTIDKCCVQKFVGHADANTQRLVDDALRCSLAL